MGELNKYRLRPGEIDALTGYDPLMDKIDATMGYDPLLPLSADQKRLLQR